MKLALTFLAAASILYTGCARKPAPESEIHPPENSMSLEEQQQILDNLSRSYEINLDNQEL